MRIFYTSPQASRCPWIVLAAGLFLWPLVAASCESSNTPTESVESPRAAGLEEARELIRDGEYASAESRARAILSEAEIVHGTESPEVAAVLRVLVEALWRGGKARQHETRQLGFRALRICETAHGPEHPEVARVLHELGNLFATAGEYDTANNHYQRSLAIRRDHFGQNHPDVARTLFNLGNLHHRMGEYETAETFFRETLQIEEQVYGADHLEVAWTLNGLAVLLNEIGRYDAAESLFRRCLEIRRKRLEADHVQIAWSLNNLANLYKETANYTEARSLLERALEIERKRYGRDSLEVARVENNLSELLTRMGDYSEAIRLQEHALEIRRELLGDSDLVVATSLRRLARLRAETGRDREAQKLYEEALSILEREGDPDDPDRARVLGRLADLFVKTGRPDRAKRLYEQALEIQRRSLGNEHPVTARTLIRLGKLRASAGDLPAARSLYEQALEIRERALGSAHPAVAEALDRLGLILARLGDSLSSLRLALRAEQIGRNHLRLTSSTLEERRALRYAAIRPSGLDLALSLGAEQRVETSVGQIWDAVIRSRALVLDEMANRRRAAVETDDSQAADLAAELQDASRRLANLTVRGPDVTDHEAYSVLLRKTLRDKEAAERSLAERSLLFRRQQARQRIGLAEVSRHLPAGSALVGTVAFDRLPLAGDADTISSYLVFVLRSGGEPVAVPLGPASEIDRLVADWRREIAPNTLLSRGSLAEAEAAYRVIAKTLRVRIWDRIAVHLEGVERVFVVPDGALNLVSLAALPGGQSSYLVESGPQVHYLSAERDLVPRDPPARTGLGLLAVGEVDFEKTAHGARVAATQTSTANVALRGPLSDCPQLRTMRFEGLPASSREIEEVGQIWQRQSASLGGEVTLLSGARATEAAVKLMAPGRRTIHLATHGFFLGSDCSPTVAGSRGIGRLVPKSRDPRPPTIEENPLLLSGIALAGANRRNQPAGLGEDGILTAEEVAAMNLSGVRWVVLSACDTGLGEVIAGEGVLGLRRAFHIAGAKTIVMGLWAVEDESARLWMTSFYEAHLGQGFTTADAAQRASRLQLQRRRENGDSGHPFFWAGFVLFGEWR